MQIALFYKLYFYINHLSCK